MAREPCVCWYDAFGRHHPTKLEFDASINRSQKCLSIFLSRSLLYIHHERCAQARRISISMNRWTINYIYSVRYMSIDTLCTLYIMIMIQCICSNKADGFRYNRLCSSQTQNQLRWPFAQVRTVERSERSRSKQQDLLDVFAPNQRSTERIGDLGNTHSVCCFESDSTSNKTKKTSSSTNRKSQRTFPLIPSIRPQTNQISSLTRNGPKRMPAQSDQNYV